MTKDDAVTATFRRVNAGVVVGPLPGLTPSGDKMLSATLTARDGRGPIQRIQFGEAGHPFDNAQVSVITPTGGPSGQKTGFT